MKTILKTIFFFCAGLMLTGLCSAQTIKINSVIPAVVCGGDPITVIFTVAGNWGHHNAFTLELSDKSGSFSAFTNIGSKKGEVPGVYAITGVTPQRIDNNWPNSSAFRVRVIGATPYIESADTGNFIINTAPVSLNITTPENPPLMVNTQYIVAKVDNEALNFNPPYIFQQFFGHGIYGRVDFNYGDGASPTTYSENTAPGNTVWTNTGITYSSAGYKTVSIFYTETNHNACYIDTSISIHIFAPLSSVTIPKYTIVDSGQNQLMDTSSDPTRQRPLSGYGKRIWINPGVTYHSPSVVQDTFFCESGSSLFLKGIECVVYLKRGASYTLASGLRNTIYEDTSTSVLEGKPNSDGTIKDTIVGSPGLYFILDSAPPNKAFPLVVKDNFKPEEMLIVPNPTSSYITAKNIPSYTISITVYNALGAQVMEVLPHGESSMTLDLKKCESGVYFIRIISDRGVVTKKIIKE